MAGKKTKEHMVFSIRNKIILCFFVPIIFMVVIGISAYQKSAEGMNEKFRVSTEQTIKMATEYVDMVASFIEAEGVKYAFDNELSSYFIGMLESDNLKKASLVETTRKSLSTSRLTNDFISNIHIVTRAGVNMLTTYMMRGRMDFWPNIGRQWLRAAGWRIGSIPIRCWMKL